MPKSPSSVWPSIRSALAGLRDDHLRHAEVPRERPDLGLEEVAERVDRRRVVGVPGEVAEQPLGLVAGAERERAVGRGEIEQRDHAGARHDVAEAARARVRRRWRQLAVHGGADVDRRAPRSRARRSRAGACSRLSGLEVRYGIRTPMHVLRRRAPPPRGTRPASVHAAGEADDHLLEPAPALHLVAEELDQPAPGQLRVDVEGVGRWTDGPADAERRAWLVGLDSCAVRSRAGLPRSAGPPAVDPPLLPPRRVQRSQQVGQPHLEIGEQRQVRPRAGDLLEVERRRDQRLLEQRALARSASPRGIRHERAAGKRLAALEAHQLRQRDDRRRARRRCPGRSAPAGEARWVGPPPSSPDRCRAPGSRSGTMMSCAPSSAASIGVNECQASSQIRIAARPQRRVERLHAPPGLDEALLVEHSVGRQEHLAVDVPDAGVGPAQRDVERRSCTAGSGAARRSRARRRAAGPWRRDAGARDRRTAGRPVTARSRTPPSRK